MATAELYEVANKIKPASIAGGERMTLTTQDKMLIEQRVTNEAKSVGAAYLLWFFLWFFSAHRFYLGRPGSAVLQILSYFIIIGFVWVIIDAFLIPGMVQQQKEDVRQKLTLEALSHSGD